MRREVSAASLFEAAVTPGREHELEAAGLELVARPGMMAPEAASNLVAVRRGLGEGRLAVISAVESISPNRARLESGGIPCEGYKEGVFIEVEGVRGRRGLRIAGPDGHLAEDVVLLRERGKTPGRSGRQQPFVPAEDTGTMPEGILLAAVIELRRRRARSVREDYLRSLLDGSGDPSLRSELQRTGAELARRQPSTTGPDRAAAVSALVSELAEQLLAAVERAFILDERRSALELLEPAERDRYLGFAWQRDDFPGKPTGANEARAEQMFSALTGLRPERRANSGDTAAVRSEEFDAAMQRRITAALTNVAGEAGQRLHRDAAASYVAMRTAAAGEGVTLSINNSYRPLSVAQANAAAAGNRAAVAAFSSHTLSLAVDLNMSHGTLRFTETTTRPFRNVVDMYKSPVHKWMFLRGETHGWFPYRREPWHWEYNPPGFRERLRQPATTDVARETVTVMEAITDPIAPPRSQLSITGTVGRGGRNSPADVRAVQDRLVELRAAAAADLAAERPSGTAAVGEAALARTIAAIEGFQRGMSIPSSGSVAPRDRTRTELDLASPQPTAAEFTAVGTELATIGQTVSRGLTITGPVGATAGNAIADVRAVQQRLVDVGRLAATHRESPAATATGSIPQSRLSATIAALRAFQADVNFFLGRRTISGAVTPGVLAPGDATAALLDRLSAYVMTSGTNRVSFRDHIASGVTVSDTGVMFRGTAAPSALPVRAYTDLGLQAAQAAALQFVSSAEGNFDAINTYDRAIVSAGFIQFAGGRGLPPYIALLKARQAAKFRDLLQKFGIDVEFTVTNGAITSPRLVVLDPSASQVLRATAAETAIRDDKRLTTALILSGRDRDVQIIQIEAAARGYVLPILDANIAPSTRGGRARLGDFIRSEKGMAALFDRAIQEGLDGGRRRFERVVQRLVRQSEPRPLPTPPPAPPTAVQLQSREGDVIAEVERDLQSAADVHTQLKTARTALEALLKAANAAGATVAALLARAEVANARRAVNAARVGLADVVNVSGSNDDAQITSIGNTLDAETRRLAFNPAPSSVADLKTAIGASRTALSGIMGPFSTAPMFLTRIQKIRRSTLDSALTRP